MGDDAVIEALTEQIGLYRRLAKLALIQHEHVRHSRTEQLLEVLKSRQDVLQQITASEQTIGPARRRWPQYLAAMEPGPRQRAESLLAETRELLRKITSADRDDAIVLQQRKLSLGKQINQAVSARQVHRRYAVAAYGKPPSRMDLSR